LTILQDENKQDPFGFETWDLVQAHSSTQKYIFTLGGQFAAARGGQYDRRIHLTQFKKWGTYSTRMGNFDVEIPTSATHRQTRRKMDPDEVDFRIIRIIKSYYFGPTWMIWKSFLSHRISNLIESYTIVTIEILSNT